VLAVPAPASRLSISRAWSFEVDWPGDTDRLIGRNGSPGPPPRLTAPGLNPRRAVPCPRHARGHTRRYTIRGVPLTHSSALPRSPVGR
jgi:hypothetical protein